MNDGWRRRRAGILGLAAAIALVAGYRSLRAPDSPVPADHAAGAATAAPGPAPSAMRSANPPPVECAEDSDRHNAEPAVIAGRERASARVLDAMAAAFADHPDAADRALAAFVRYANSPGMAHEQFARGNPQCANDPACGPAEDAAVAQAARPYRDALADIAAVSNDAAAYALAVMACDTGYPAREPGECAQISARQWARIEPDNAQPWLYLASEADGQETPAQVAEALYRAAQAPRSDLHWERFARLLDSEFLRGQSAEVRTDVTRTVMAMAVAGRFAPLSAVLSHCTATTLADSNRRQVCDDLARLLTERSDTLVALAVGTALGERLGWSPARLEALRDRRSAFDQLMSERVGADSFRCESQASQREWFAQTLRYGELGALRRAIAASGRTESWFAQQRRAAVAQTASRTPVEPAPDPGARAP